MLNKVMIMGRITADLEVKKTNSGKEYVNFSVAVDQPPRVGEKRADFFRCTAWGSTAVFIGRYFKKGSMILLEGAMHNDDYTDKDGVKHYGMSMTVQSVSFTGERQQEAESAAQDNGAVMLDPIPDALA